MVHYFRHFGAVYEEHRVEHDTFLDRIRPTSLILLSKEKSKKFVKKHILFGLGVLSTAEFSIWHPGKAVHCGGT